MTRREQYLAALGIDLWQARIPAPPEVRAPTLQEPVAPALQEVRAAALEAPDALDAAAPSCDAAHGDAAIWQTLRAEVSTCTRCELCRARTQTVFGVGDTRAELLVIGEAPGAEEDRMGEPFVGRAGQLLNSMLRAMGTSRERVYIANMIKCRPPGNRDPKPDEIASCLPYLQRQVELLRPRLILAVGRIAAQNLLATDTPIGRLRGRLHRFGPGQLPMIVTYHPAYLLRSPIEKRKAWSDLKFARAELARLRPHQSAAAH